jgi:hypothetical protein
VTHVAQEVEPFVLVRARTIGIFAVHDARLVWMKFQTDLRHPFGNGRQHMLCLGLGRTVHYRIIRVALETGEGELLRQPRIERIVEEKVSQQG